MSVIVIMTVCNDGLSDMNPSRSVMLPRPHILALAASIVSDSKQCI